MTACKILHMHFGKEGGAERFFVALAQGFGERGMEQRFVIRPNRSFDAVLSELGPVIRDNYRRVSLTAPFLTRRVRRLVRTWQPDVIMAWMSRASRLFPRDTTALKVTRLGDYPRHLRNFRNTDVIVSNVPGIAEKCLALGWDRPLHIISNFPREVLTVPVNRESLNTPADAFVLAGSGRFVDRKGFDTLVRAVARVPDTWLWLMGDGPLRTDLEALVHMLGVTHRTRFLGWVDEPMHYVAAADAYCMPSRHEPLGNVILEAWYCGVPAISTRSEGPGWFVTGEEDALMVDIDDIAAMAAAITRLRDDPRLRAELVKAGRGKLEAHFTEQRILDQYSALFSRTPASVPGELRRIGSFPVGRGPI